MKAAMRARDAARLSALRLALAAIQQKEVDTRAELSDADTLGVLEKMIKQRRESIAQFESAGRSDLAEAEKRESELLSTYLPARLADAELAAAIDAAIAESGAAGPRDMGKVMAILRAKLAGRVDMAEVSSRVKGRLSG